MDRSRSHSRAPSRRRDRSLSSSPSQSRSPSRTRRSRRSSRARSDSYDSFDSYSPSHSRSRSRSRTRSRSRSEGGEHKSSKHKDLLKSSAGLLAGIGIASYVAHKFWPKGVMYGDKEDWETTRKVVHKREGDGRGGQRSETVEEEMVPGRRGERGAIEQKRTVEHRGREDRGREDRGRGGRGQIEDGRRRDDDEGRRRWEDEQRRRAAGGARWDSDADVRARYEDERRRGMGERRREDERPRRIYAEERIRRIDDGYPRVIEAGGGRAGERYYRRDGQPARPDEMIYVVEERSPARRYEGNRG